MLSKPFLHRLWILYLLITVYLSFLSFIYELNSGPFRVGNLWVCSDVVTEFICLSRCSPSGLVGGRFVLLAVRGRRGHETGGTWGRGLLHLLSCPIRLYFRHLQLVKVPEFHHEVCQLNWWYTAQIQALVVALQMLRYYLGEWKHQIQNFSLWQS